MSQPKVDIKGYTYLFNYEQEQVSIFFDRLHEDGKATKAEVWVKSAKSDPPRHIHQTKLDMTSTTTKKSVAKQLEERYQGVPWAEMLEQCCIAVLTHFRRGEPCMKIITDSEKIVPPEYLIYPVLPRYQPTVIHGDGATWKSGFAQLLCLLIISAWQDNPFGLRLLHKEPKPCLYLDWETDDKTMNYQMTLLQIGQSRPSLTLHYRRCYQPFADDLAEIHKLVDEIKPEFLVIDNAAAAIQGDMYGPEGATRLLTRDIRQLHVTSLVIAHESKREGERRTPFGSIFFRNYARSVWEARKRQETDESRLDFGLICHKSNIDKLFKPMAFEVNFFDEGTVVSRIDITDVPELAEALPLSDRIQASLLRSGPATVEELGEVLGMSPEGLSPLLSNRADRFVRLTDGKWAVKTRRQQEEQYG